MTPPPGPAAHETFLVLPHNEFAFAAVSTLRSAANGAALADAAARSKARHRSRLVYLEGPSGTGKSHLARYLSREVRQHEPRARCVLVTAAQFASELAEASDEERVPEFQKRYRAVDLLVCEDLTALENRRATQEQLVAAIDHVLGAGGRVLLTCRKPPRDLEGVLPRLVSRCRGGVYAALTLPDREARGMLLAHFAHTRQIAVRPHLLERLADALPVSPRELLAALEQLEARARLANGPLDEDLVRRFLRSEEFAPAATLTAVAKAVAKEFGIPLRTLRDPSRTHSGLVPRHCAMWLARELTSRPLREIARYFGRNNHSTVVHACERLKGLLENDPGLRHHLAQIRQSLGRVDQTAGRSQRTVSVRPRRP